MNILIITGVLFLFGLAIWLIKLCQTQTAQIQLVTIISPKQFLRYHTLYEFNEKHFLLKLASAILFLIVETYFISNGYVFLAIIIFVLLLAFASSFCISSRGYSIDEEQLKEIKYVGKLKMPSNVYAGNSDGIDINLNIDIGRSYKTSQFSYDNNGESEQSVDLLIPMVNAEESFLAIELQAAGLTVDGEKKQEKPLTIRTLSYHWNCYYPNSGMHTINFIIKLIGPHSEVELGILKRTVRVTKFLGLTKRQVEIVGWVCGGIVGFFGLITLVFKLVRMIGL